jgi:hypothetical protein
MSVFRKLPPIVPVVDVIGERPFQPVTIVQRAEDFKADQEAFENLLIEHSAVKKQLDRVNAKYTIATSLISKHLDEIEGQFDSDEKFPSVEAALDYITSAKWMADNDGRTNNRIDAVQMWIDSPDSLPFK